jgi:hypothetical protein
LGHTASYLYYACIDSKSEGALNTPMLSCLPFPLRIFSSFKIISIPMDYSKQSINEIGGDWALDGMA